MDAVTRLLSDLVAIPSVNPMGRPLSGPGFLEAGMSDYLERWFRELGVPCERQTVAPGRDNLLARYEAPGRAADAPLRRAPGHGPDRRHDDPSVRPGDRVGSALRPGRPATSRGGWRRCSSPSRGWSASGRGARRRSSWPAPWTRSSPTPARRTWRRRRTGPTWRSSPSRPGSTWSTATRARCAGRSGPAGSPATARRPTWASTRSTGWPRVVAALAEHAEELSRAAPHPVLGPPSLSVGRIEGGQSVNVVPDWCEIEVDRRIIPGEDARECIARVERFLRDRLGGLEDLEFLPPWVDMPSLAPDDDGVDRLGRRRRTGGRLGDGPDARGHRRALRHRRRAPRRRRACPAWSSGRATSPRHTRRMSGSSSTRSARPSRPIIRSPATWAG